MEIMNCFDIAAIFSRQLKSVIKQCVDFGESNSVLVIGPRGSGKSKVN